MSYLSSSQFGTSEGMMAGSIFAFCVLILAIGFVWFWIVRPILEDAGLITVNDYEDTAPHVMSRSEDAAPVDRPSSLQTDNRQTTDKPAAPPASRDVMLNTYRLLRKYGIPREEARPVLKAAGFPLDNNLWADAAPAQPPADEPEYTTPIVGRATNARFEPVSDPDFPFEPCRS